MTRKESAGMDAIAWIGLRTMSYGQRRVIQALSKSDGSLVNVKGYWRVDHALSLSEGSLAQGSRFIRFMLAVCMYNVG